MRYALMAAGLLSLLVSLPAIAAGRQDFTLINRTGYTIDEVYVARNKSDDWGEDILDQDILEEGQSVVITFPKRAAACLWDLLVVYEDGEEAEWTAFDLCEVSRIGLRYNRKTGDTWADYE